MGTLRSSVLSCALTLVFAAGASAQSKHPASEHMVDLTDNHWCHTCVVKVVDNYSVMSGFQDHTFRGDWSVNRYELAAAVTRSYNQILLTHKIALPTPNDTWQHPIGTPANHWAYSYVRKLVIEDGLFGKLFEDGNFNGDKVLTRHELAYGLSEFLMQMEKSMGRKLDPERRESQLAVDLDPRSPFNSYIQSALNRYQFMNLHSDHTFRPDRPVTRYELAASLCKVFELFEKDAGKVASHEEESSRD